MLKYVVPLSSFIGFPLFTVGAVRQENPVQLPIACGVKDNVEDAECQNGLKAVFTRKGDALTLKLDGGKAKTYVGNAAACAGANLDISKCEVVVLLKYFPQTRSFLVARRSYECGTYLFVNRRTGSETVMYAIPALSPNAKYLLSVDTNDACDRKYDIAIWSMQTDPPKLEFTYDPGHTEYWEPLAWEGDTHIKLKGVIPLAPAPYDQEARLVRNQSGWTLQLGHKTARPN